MALSLLSGVLVIVILVFCVLAVVMAAIRPSLFSSFVRGFGGEDAKSDEGTQEPIKFINWKKGMFRLTLVLSVPLAWLFGGDIGEEWFGSGMRGFFTGVLIFFLLIWLVYFLIGPAIIRAITFVMKGFMDKN